MTSLNYYDSCLAISEEIGLQSVCAEVYRKKAGIMFLAGNEINLYPRATELTKERLKDINRKRKGKIRFSISFKRDENGKEDAISVDFLIPTSRKNTFKDINSF